MSGKDVNEIIEESLSVRIRKEEYERLKALEARYALEMAMRDRAYERGEVVPLDEATKKRILNAFVEIEFVSTSYEDTGCGFCGEYQRDGHERDCEAAYWLRVFGDEEERQRQVEHAHDAALREEEYRNRPRGASRPYNLGNLQDHLRALYTPERIRNIVGSFTGGATIDFAREGSRDYTMRSFTDLSGRHHIIPTSPAGKYDLVARLSREGLITEAGVREVLSVREPTNEDTKGDSDE